MRGRKLIGQVVGVAVALVLLAVMAAVLRWMVVGRSAPAAGQTGAPEKQGGDARVDCSRLITPQRVGPEAFAQHGMADKLENGEFSGGAYAGYIYCSHGRPQIEDGSFYADVDILYMFDAETGGLALTKLAWENPQPPAEPAATPVPTPTPNPNAVTVCMDGNTPLVETGEEVPRQFTIWDILGGNCSVSMSNQICFACGDGAHLLVPSAMVRDDDLPVWTGNGETLCIDATTAMALQSEAGGEPVEVAAPERCSFQLGGGAGMCWVCSGGEPEPAPSSSPVPTEGIVRAPACDEYLTEEAIGAEEWERYGIGDKVGADWFERLWFEGHDEVVCSGHQTVAEAVVFGTELYYMFDLRTGALLKKRIEWRHDLPEQLPPLAVDREAAEGMVKGEVRSSYLGFLSPGSLAYGISQPTFRDPCWFVSAQEEQDDICPCMTVINAMTGEVIGHWMQ